MNHVSESPCSATLLTPAGRGAIATLAVFGPDAARIVGRRFVPRRAVDLETAPVGRILFGNWLPDSGPGEEIVVCRRADDEWEIHCHGGRSAAEAILQGLAADGARLADAPAWLQRHASDRLAAEARLALGAASTERTAVILLDQYRGALRRELEIARAAVDQGALERAAASLSRLAAMSRVGLHLTQPWRVVVAGPPNAGKSSLVNAILGYSRSIVFHRPGTTRDVVAAPTALDGWPVELFDTAGLRAGGDAIESEGVARARAQMHQADLVLLVFDATTGWPESHRQLAAEWPQSLVVGNKADLLRDESPAAAWQLTTSALTGQGLAELLDTIVRRLVPVSPQPGEAVPFSPEHITALHAAQAALAAHNPMSAATILAQLVSPTARDRTARA
jgi:tRNA modification GTPase